MNQTLVPNSGPKLRLIEAAEKLFAEKGFEAVSVRDITKEAGANVAAVNYHFGSRDGLVVAVISRYLNPVNQERLARLERAEKGGSVEDVLAAFVLPTVELVAKSELTEKLYTQLLGRIFAERTEILPGDLEKQTKIVVERFTKALSKLLPNVPAEELVWHLHFVVGGLIHVLTHSAFLYRVSGSLAGNPTMDQTISRFLKFAAAGVVYGSDPSAEEAKPKVPQSLFDF
jgi:AcrR family transcriptional regulator